MRYNAAMDEKYQLVFRGEVLDGQHRAVVKRRLVESLKLTDEQAEKLFSGAAVVLKKAVDAAMAARYQALFKQAGGRLRVHSLAPAKPADTPEAAAPAPAAELNSAETVTTTPSPSAPETAAAPTTDQVSPALTLLSLEEIDKAAAEAAGERVEISAPDFVVAELGADLADTVEPVVVMLPEADFSIAAAGEDLLESRPEPAVVEVGPLDFEVAEVGANLALPSDRPAPAAPDISHLQITEEA